MDGIGRGAVFGLKLKRKARAADGFRPLPSFAVVKSFRSQHAAHDIRRLPLRRGGHVGIGVQGEPGAVVPQYTRDGFDVHAVLQRQGGEGVPQVMESHSRQSRPFQYPVQHVPHTVRGDGNTFRARIIPDKKASVQGKPLRLSEQLKSNWKTGKIPIVTQTIELMLI